MTMNGARTLTFDPKTQHIFYGERGSAVGTSGAGGRGAPPSAIPGSFTILVIGK